MYSFLKEGYKWKATFAGKQQNPSDNKWHTISAEGVECFNEFDNALLVEADYDFFLTEALHNSLLLKAQEHCNSQAHVGWPIKCDPFDEEDEIMPSFTFVAGKCLVKGEYYSSCPEPSETDSASTTEAPTTSGTSTTEGAPTTTEAPTTSTTESSTTSEEELCDSLELGTRISCVGNTCEVQKISSMT